MSALMTRMADLAHKTVVIGLFGSFSYNIYQIGSNVMENQRSAAGKAQEGGQEQEQEQEHPQAGFIQMLRDKNSEEYKKYHQTDHREWYDKDDDSYLKQIPKPEEYQPKRK